MIQNLKLVVFDMSGTTIEDYNEVLTCFSNALTQSGINRTDEDINTMMGWSKIEVFRHIWQEEMQDHDFKNSDDRSQAIMTKAEETFKIFKQILEDWYEKNPIEPTEGCLETFDFLRSQGIKIALNTGFYRKVADILFKKLGWSVAETFDFTITSDEVLRGRPAPFMIEQIMAHFGITNPLEVAKIGDTPSDLGEGRAAGVWTFGLVNGTHTREALENLDSDGLFDSLTHFSTFLKEKLTPSFEFAK